MTRSINDSNPRISRLAHEVFQFFVRAEDSGVPSLGTEVPIDVLILETQEKAPAFERTSSKYFISESAPIGIQIQNFRSIINLYFILPRQKWVFKSTRP